MALFGKKVSDDSLKTIEGFLVDVQRKLDELEASYREDSFARKYGTQAASFLKLRNSITMVINQRIAELCRLGENEGDRWKAWAPNINDTQTTLNKK